MSTTPQQSIYTHVCNEESCGLLQLLRVYAEIHHTGFREPSPVLQNPWAVKIVSLCSNIELGSSVGSHLSIYPEAMELQKIVLSQALCRT